MKQKITVSDKIVGRPIRLNTQTLLTRGGNNHAEVMFIGDAHYGSPQFDKVRFLAQLQYCLTNQLYIMLMGDLCEVATRHSVGAGVYEQECVAESQHEQMVAWLQPLADMHLILGTHQGNHGERVYKETGVNIDKALARELHVPYLGDACWSQFRVGMETYSIYSLHGRSGSRFDGTALLALERISTSFFADLVCCGHSHKCINSVVLMQRVINSQVKEHKKFLLICGSYLKYDGGYGQTVGLPISKLGSPKVKFFSDKHDLSITW
jgi:predicted MPP superfamily phosphohydrolase